MSNNLHPSTHHKKETKNRTKKFNTSLEQKTAASHNIQNQQLDRRPLDFWSIRQMPINNAYLDAVAHRMLMFSREKDALVFGEFIVRENTTRERMNEWCSRSPALAEAKKATILALGVNREIQALKRYLDPTMCKANQGLYDPEWKQHEKWKAEIRSQEAFKAQNLQFNISMPKFSVANTSVADTSVSDKSGEPKTKGPKDTPEEIAQIIHKQNANNRTPRLTKVKP